MKRTRQRTWQFSSLCALVLLYPSTGTAAEFFSFDGQGWTGRFKVPRSTYSWKVSWVCSDYLGSIKLHDPIAMSDVLDLTLGYGQRGERRINKSGTFQFLVTKARCSISASSS